MTPVAMPYKNFMPCSSTVFNSRKKSGCWFSSKTLLPSWVHSAAVKVLTRWQRCRAMLLATTNQSAGIPRLSARLSALLADQSRQPSSLCTRKSVRSTEYLRVLMDWKDSMKIGVTSSYGHVNGDGALVPKGWAVRGWALMA